MNIVDFRLDSIEAGNCKKQGVLQGEILIPLNTFQIKEMQFYRS